MRRRHAGVGHRDDDVGRRPAARAPAGGRAPCAPRRRCGRRPCCRGARSRRTRRCSGARGACANGRQRRDARRASMTTISPGSTSRTYSASIRSSAQVSDATTQASLDAPEHERPEAVRIAHGDQLRPRSGRPASRRPAPGASASTTRSIERLGRSTRAIRWTITSVSTVDWKIEPRASSCARSSLGVDQVAVVGDRERARAALDARTAARS